jgi:hypothetical protein
VRPSNVTRRCLQTTGVPIERWRHAIPTTFESSTHDGRPSSRGTERTGWRYRGIRSSFEATRVFTSSNSWWRVIKNTSASDVHVDVPVLEVKELGIECAESLHHASPLPVGTPFRALRPTISPAQGPLAGVFDTRTGAQIVTFDVPGNRDALDSN